MPKSMYEHLPKDKNPYVIVYKKLSIIDAYDEFFIQTVTNVYKYISNHKKDKIILLKYYPISDAIFDESILDSFCSDTSTNLFVTDDIQKIYNLLEVNLGNAGSEPKLNRGKNLNLNCSYSNSDCKFRPKNLVDVLTHAQNCKIYQYTLFNQEIPKEVIKALKNTKKDYEEMKKKTRQMEKIDKRIHYRYFESTLSEISKRVCYDVREKNYILPDDKAFVYIGESRHWKNWGESYYKIGKVSSKGLIKSRLVQYNTGRIMGMDDFYFLYLFSVENNDEALKLEKEIKKNFRDYQIKSSEIYKGLSLEELKNFII